MSEFVRQAFDHFKDHFDASLVWRDKLRDRFFRLSKALPVLIGIHLFVFRQGIKLEIADYLFWTIFGFVSVALITLSLCIVFQLFNPPAYRQSRSPLSDLKHWVVQYEYKTEHNIDKSLSDFIREGELFQMAEDAEFNDRLNARRNDLKNLLGFGIIGVTAMLIFQSVYVLTMSIL